jgi:DNA modification methylase
LQPYDPPSEPSLGSDPRRSDPQRGTSAAPAPRTASSRRFRSLSAPSLSFQREGDPDTAERLRLALSVPPLPDQLQPEDRRELEAALCTHLFHSFAGRAHPLTIRHLLADVPPGAIVLDPFVGSGTVLVEAVLRGARAIGCDISELALRLSRFKATPLPPSMGKAIHEQAERIGEASLQRVKKRQRPSQTWDKPQFYPPHVYLELCGLRAEIDGLVRRDPPIGEALLLIFSSIVVKASRQRSETNPAPFERHIGAGQVSRWFVAKAAEVARLHAALWTRVQDLSAREKGAARERPLCISGDARSVLTDPEALPLWAGSVDCIVTSPPYLGTYDYVDHHARRYPWLGIDPAPMARAEMAARRNSGDRSLRELLQTHQQDSDRWLAGVARVLKPDGILHVLVGDSTVQGEVVRGDLPVRRAAETCGLRFVARVAAERPHFLSPTGPTLSDGAAPRLEHLLTFRGVAS